MDSVPADRSPGPDSLYDEARRVERRLTAYYGVLNENEEIRGDLRRLYETLRHLITQPVVASDRAAHLLLFMRAARGQAPVDDSDACQQLEAFAERRLLPREYGTHDVWWSLC